MRFLLMMGILIGAASGCGTKEGAGLWSLRVGEDAVLSSAEGGEITLERLTTGEVKKRNTRKAKADVPEQVRLANGTRVVILAIDGDDARVEVKEGEKAGTVYWASCADLKPASR